MFDVVRGVDTATTVIRKRRASGRGSRPLSFCVAISQPVCNGNYRNGIHSLIDWNNSSRIAGWSYPKARARPGPGALWRGSQEPPCQTNGWTKWRIRSTPPGQWPSIAMSCR